MYKFVKQVAVLVGVVETVVAFCKIEFATLPS